MSWFKTYIDSNALTLKPWEWNYYSFTRKRLDFRIWVHVFFKNDFAITQEPLFLNIIYHYLYPGISIFGIDLVSSPLVEKLT